MSADTNSGAAARGAITAPEQAPLLSRLWAEYFWPAVFAGPAIVGFLSFKLIPIVASFLIGLTDWRVSAAPNWVGLANFQKLLFDDPLFWKSLGVTLGFTAMSVPTTMIVALALAMLINLRMPGIGIFRTIFYLPSIMPIVATSVLWLWLFNPDLGLLNAGLRAIGLPKSQWLYAEGSVLPSMVLMSLWGIGPMMIIFLGGLQGIPRDLYEAVDIDGGNGWDKFWNITLPILTPTILFNLVIAVIVTLQSIVQAAIMTEGGPNNSSLFIVYYIYRTAFNFSQMGYASAMSWVFFVITCTIGFLILGTSRRWVFYYGQR